MLYLHSSSYSNLKNRNWMFWNFYIKRLLLLRFAYIEWYSQVTSMQILASKWDQNIHSKELNLTHMQFYAFLFVMKNVETWWEYWKKLCKKLLSNEILSMHISTLFEKTFPIFCYWVFSFFPILIKTHKTNLEIGRQQRDRRHHFSMPHQITFLCLFGGMRHMMHKM